MPLYRHTTMTSRYVVSRPVDVWLPETIGDRRLPVIYMHDGQNLFDPALRADGEVWAVDRAIERLQQERNWPGAIVVGIWCTDQRWREYAPQQPFNALRQTRGWEWIVERMGGEPVSDAYLAFLVEEVKPWIDMTYPTLPDQSNTFVMGSSMGGLISLYALCRYPDIFRGAGCLSTHWPAGGTILVDELAARLPPPGRHRFYFDYGTDGLDAEYEPFQQRMDSHMVRVGYRHGHDWLTRKFPGATHNEAAWRARVADAIAFVMDVSSG
ncbi:MAG: esterase [Chloroflexus aggregans]|uniref:Esterase n=1 Tax=Chloroflexus aggregans TaxID=152260 RepID=A0A2J6XAM8_9CHLR|nr:MAG: esterase [Chloroflexus aggregans]